MSLLKKLKKHVAVMSEKKAEVRKQHLVAKSSSPTWEERLRKEGLAPLYFPEIGEVRQGKDEPLFSDEYTNPAPGVSEPSAPRDQVLPPTPDDTIGRRRDYTDSVVACDQRWSNFLQMVEHLKAMRPGEVWGKWKDIEDVLKDERRAIFGGDPTWDKKSMCWSRDTGATQFVGIPYAMQPVKVTCSASDSRLSLTKGQAGALKAIVLQLAGYECGGCKSVSDGHSDGCYSCEGLTKVRADYAAYLLRRKAQAVKAAPLRRFTDMDPIVRGGEFSVFSECSPEDYVWALVAPWVGEGGRRELVDLLR